MIDIFVENIIEHDDPYLYARSLQKDEYEHWEKDNEWVHASVANYAITLAYSYIGPESRWSGNKDVLLYAEKTIKHLVNAAVDDRWYHRKPRMGDANIDRFTALPLIESIHLLGNILSSEIRDNALKKLDAVLQIQLCEYGERGRIYPNMDAYYCLIMWHGHELLGRQEYRDEYLRFLQKMETAQFEEGAWTYIEGTNECPVYHDINVLLMGRLATFAKSERAMAMIRKSIPYYPQVIASCGMVESYTDPWWKHMWNSPCSYGPDTVSSLTGDGHNRWIADLLRIQTNQEAVQPSSNIRSIFLVYAASMWKDVLPEPVSDETITYDKNIEGPRGRFAKWLWAASGRYGCDTVVGAMSNSFHDGKISALLGIRPEIFYRPAGGEDHGVDRHALGMTPRGSKGNTKIDDRAARFEVIYGMADHRLIWNEEPFPRAWECIQRWTMDAEKLCGHIEIISLNDQESHFPIIRIRWGRNGCIEEKGDGRFIYGPFSFTAKGDNFPLYAIEKSKTMPCRKELDAWDIVFSTGQYQGFCQKGLKFNFFIDIAFTE
ncbi:MAG: hypothetical protein A2017_20890 [Lentisphaerae bacterium GWF2_44_16]|nr:MAG: hypothetical protein A2017_20890 [Lentisphaerae bacterium GWF2_44_16]